MYSGHALALALGVVDSSAVLGDDEVSRRQLIRAGETMVGSGLSIVLNRQGTKIPMCTLTAVERKNADQAAQDAAAAGGDQRAHTRKHACGLTHAISDAKTATRVLTRVSKRERFNIGVEPRASRVVIVDLDTAKQANEFAMRCGQDRPTLTVRSPGKRDGEGNWVHRDGGHIWYEVPTDIELPTGEGVYTDTSGWSVIWGEHQVLVPPSARSEGPYVLVGSMHPLPQWLLDLITTETLAKQERREEARARRSLSGPSGIDDWAAGTTWADILTADGWTETGLVKNCGCPQWTAPGEHASPESATAHEPGCSVYVCERGHGPLHVWTDSPSDAVAAAVAAYGTRTLTMLQVLTHTEGDGQMGRTLNELGIERSDGPTVISGPFVKWAEIGEMPRPEDADVSVDEAADDEADEDDEPAVVETPEAIAAKRERRLDEQEYEREKRRRRAIERIEAESAPRLVVVAPSGFFNAPRPRPMVMPRPPEQGR